VVAVSFYVAKVDAVTPEQVREAFRRRIDPAGFTAVVVGGGPPKAAGG
jgi:hypothetical protein